MACSGTAQGLGVCRWLYRWAGESMSPLSEKTLLSFFLTRSANFYPLLMVMVHSLPPPPPPPWRFLD